MDGAENTIYLYRLRVDALRTLPREANISTFAAGFRSFSHLAWRSADFSVVHVFDIFVATAFWEGVAI